MKTLIQYILIFLVIIVLVIPSIRFVFKRMNCARKLKKLCLKLGYPLHRMHSFCFFGSRRAKRCDFVIETPSQVFAVKLFGVLHTSRVLVFRETGEYFFRRYSSILLFIFDVFDGAFRRMPEYDFSRGEAIANGKPRRDILLLSPIPMEVRIQPHSGQESVTGPGDVLFDMELASLSHLLRILENAA